ncbi:GlcG/HbpS family heme-binding protein [Massilia niastensis]|uniref:GlcG/HbpS family heme-binding protein n=1 Tax=Massilia niastensis TaxID=544911 RepID=UPI0003A8AAA1|nr:heme-binding protein [Massilia niastensis]
MSDSMGLNLEQANRILTVALAAARTAAMQPVAVVVLDAAGHPVALQREDGASMLRVDIALGKAWAAAGMGVSSRVLHGRAQGNPAFFNALSANNNGRFIPQTGAVVIKRADGVVIGAVGASGGSGDEDEAICIAGVAAIGLSAA